MHIKTSAKQDVAFIGAVLTMCKQRNRLSYDFIHLHLKDAAYILDGRPLAEDSSDYEEKLRTKRFHRYCDLVVSFLLLVKLLTEVEETIDNFGSPQDFLFLKITRLGRVFLRLPTWTQVCLVYVSLRVIALTSIIKKYRWVASVVSVLTGVLKWVNSHSLTSMAVFASLIVGLVAALLAAGASRLLNEPANGVSGDDDVVT